jgi:hypothetical protein
MEDPFSKLKALAQQLLQGKLLRLSLKTGTFPWLVKKCSKLLCQIPMVFGVTCQGSIEYDRGWPSLRYSTLILCSKYLYNILQVRDFPPLK